MPDITRKRKPKAKKQPTITVGPITFKSATDIDVKAINKQLDDNRKFEDDRIKRLRRQMFRKDI